MRSKSLTPSPPAIASANGEPGAFRKSPSGMANTSGRTAEITSAGSVKGASMAPCHVPAVHDVVHEVEADRLRAREGGARAEFGECERCVEHAVVGEGVDHVGGGSGIGTGRIGHDGVGDGRGVPAGGIGTVTPGRRGESMVLNGHVCQQLGQVPAVARSRATQVFRRHRVDHVDGCQHCDAMFGADILISKHPQIICNCLRSVNV